MKYTYKAKKGVMVFECDKCKKIYLTKNGIEKHLKYYCPVDIGRRLAELADKRG